LVYQFPSVVRELSSSQDFYGRRWPTLTFDLVTSFLILSVSCM